MVDKILEILGEEKDCSYELPALADKIFEDPIPANYKQLEDELEKLIKLGKVYKTKKNKYMLLENSHLLQGKLQTVVKNDKIFGFVLLDEEDLYIPANSLNGAVDGDIVTAEVTNKKGVKLEGRVINIIERKTDELLGEIVFNLDKPEVMLENKKLDYKINLVSYPDNLVDGLKVIIKFIKKISNKEYDAQVIKVLGHKNEPGMDILLVAHEFGIPTEFPEAVLKEAKEIPVELDDDLLNKELKVRADLRNKEIFTIDGADTKDIDDAISLAVLNNGNYSLGVHIADVSYYVTEKSELKKEAFNRGNSYYLGEKVIPMLPIELSNGICSLNPNVDRFAVSCVMEINKNGEIINYDVFKSVINSKKKMTYEEVNQVLDGKYIDDYESFKNTLLKMKELSILLRKEKVSRGYIDFGNTEIKYEIDESGKISKFLNNERGFGEKLIEDFMIAANESVASYIYNMNLPFIYRVHDKPAEEKLKEFVQFISLLGYTVTGKFKYDNIRSKDIQNILNQLKDKEEFPVISDKLLRSMSKAIYSPDNIGHFGLASKIYTHFTSPIRRYSDLMVHYFLDEYVFSGRIDSKLVKSVEQQLTFITEHISTTERTADSCEREVDKMKIAEYMENHIGSEYVGVIDGVMNRGFFVETKELISGLVPVQSLKGYYTYNEDLMALVNKNNDMYRLGDKVKVVCTRASKEQRQIDFEVIEKL